MGICQSRKPEQDSDFNKYKDNEESIGLHHIHFKDLAPKMAEWRNEKVKADEYIEGVSKLPGGEKLTGQNKAVLGRLLQHTFFSEGSILNNEALFSLGLLMSKGKTREKIEQLVLIVDSNQDGQITTTKVQQTIERMTIITSLLIPVLPLLDAFPMIGNEKLDDIDAWTKNITHYIFDNELKISAAVLQKKVGEELNFIFNANALRRKYFAKWNPEIAATQKAENP